MATHVQPPGASYLGPITDTNRWHNFQHRPDDIFICTPPKCGTTWAQATCAMLVLGTTDHGHQPGVISPWIDAAFAPIDEYLAKVEAQTHRRYIKTHTPFDGIPYYPECTYLVVLPDPRDAFLSGSNHRDNMNDQDLALTSFPNGDNAFRDWLGERRTEGAWDRFNLAAFVHFFRTYWQYRDLDNVHLFHYADLKRDLPGTISAMAGALGIVLDDAQLSSYAAAASFDNMRRQRNG